MQLVTRVWFWLLAIPLLFVGSTVVAFGLISTLDRLLGGTALNVWGDMEGLIVPMWIATAILFVFGLLATGTFVAKWSRRGGSA